MMVIHLLVFGFFVSMRNVMSLNSSFVGEIFNNTFGNNDGDDMEVYCWKESVQLGLCYSIHDDECNQCGNATEKIRFSETKIVKQTDSDGVCRYQETVSCPFFTCCPSCQDDLQLFSNCMLRAVLNATGMESVICDIDCSSVSKEDASEAGGLPNWLITLLSLVAVAIFLFVVVMVFGYEVIVELCTAIWDCVSYWCCCGCLGS